MNKFVVFIADYYNVPLYEQTDPDSFLPQNAAVGLKYHNRKESTLIFLVVDESLFTIFLLTYGNELTRSKIIPYE
jgi:hypothetical protein